jgi:cell division septum initiation protein DivIVA
LTADFPTQVRGYAKEAVDRFVHGLGARLEALEAELQNQTQRADRAAEELKKAHVELSAFHEKERALAGALVAAQEHKTAAQSEIEKMRAQAHSEANEFMDAARQDAQALKSQAQAEADEILVAARHEAEDLTAQAVRECDEHERRLEALRTEYQQTIAFIRRHLETQIAALDAPTGHAVITSNNGLAEVVEAA